MQKLIPALIILSFTGTALAAPPDVPPGLAKQGYTKLSVCDCLMVEAGRTIHEHRDFLADNATLTRIIGITLVNGAMQCVSPGGAWTPGEDTIRQAISLLTNIPYPEQEFCSSAVPTIPAEPAQAPVE